MTIQQPAPIIATRVRRDPENPLGILQELLRMPEGQDGALLEELVAEPAGFMLFAEVPSDETLQAIGGWFKERYQAPLHFLENALA